MWCHILGWEILYKDQSGEGDFVFVFNGFCFQWLWWAELGIFLSLFLNILSLSYMRDIQREWNAASLVQRSSLGWK